MSSLLSNHHLLRWSRPSKSIVLIHFCTSKSPASSRRNHHEFLPPTTYLNSWKPSRNPKETAAKLASLRRDYDRKVKEMRKAYIEEMELQRIEKLRKDEARKEVLRIANEERKAAKDAKKKAEAIERQAAEQEFRRMLMKERAEKLEYWRTREKSTKRRKRRTSSCTDKVPYGLKNLNWKRRYLRLLLIQLHSSIFSYRIDFMDSNIAFELVSA